MADMFNRDHYDKDMFKPEHEKEPEYNVDYFAKRAVERQLEMTYHQDDEHLPFLKRKFFVGVDLLDSDKSEKSANDDKIFFMVLGCLVGWAFMAFLLASYFLNILKVPLILYLILSAITGIIFTTIVVSIFGMDLESKRLERSIRGGKNVSSSLASVWGINHASIHKDNKEDLHLMYKGESAVVLKMLKKSTLVANENADISHYEGLMKIEDILSESKCTVTKYNTRYNPENDDIWIRLDNNLEKAAMVTGEKYPQLMSDILNYHYDITLKNSTVSVIYLVIKPPSRLIEKEIQSIVNKVRNAAIYTRMEIAPVSSQELMRVLRDYYGVDYLDIEAIASSAFTQLLDDMEVKLLYTVEEDGTLVNIKDLENIKLNIPSDFYKDKLEQENKFVPYEIKDNYRLTNIYEDKVYVQPN